MLIFVVSKPESPDSRHPDNDYCIIHLLEKTLMLAAALHETNSNKS